MYYRVQSNGPRQVRKPFMELSRILESDESDARRHGRPAPWAAGHGARPAPTPVRVRPLRTPLTGLRERSPPRDPEPRPVPPHLQRPVPAEVRGEDQFAVVGGPFEDASTAGPGLFRVLAETAVAVGQRDL